MSCILQGLLNLGGRSVYTKRIAEHYTDASLCRAWSSAAFAMAAQADFGSVWHLALAADQLVCASQMLQEYGPIRSLTVISLRGPGTSHIQYTRRTSFCTDSYAYNMLTTLGQCAQVSCYFIELQHYWYCDPGFFCCKSTRSCLGCQGLMVQV